MGLLDKLGFRPKSEDRRGSEKVDLDRLSNALDRTRISYSTPTKPLPIVPPTGTPSRLQQHHHHQLDHSPHSPYHLFPQHVASTYHQTNGSPRQAQSNAPSMPIADPYRKQNMLSQSTSIDHIPHVLRPGPWELNYRVSPPSHRPSAPPSSHHPRPVSAPALPIIATPAKRGKVIVVDPLQPPALRQCWGIKRDGTRCTRKLTSPSSPKARRARTPSKSPSPSKGRMAAASKSNNGGASKANAIVVLDDSEDSSDHYSDDDERREYCHQHSKEINKTKGFILPGLRRMNSKGKGNVMGGDGVYVEFDSFLANIQGEDAENCKARLRTAMSQTPTEVDWMERGYLYIYELRDRSSSTHVALKVGRAVNVYKRIQQWRSQCQSKDPFLRAIFPRQEGVPQQVLSGAAIVMERGVLISHKWERLCHIELSYLGTRLNDKCIDCGSRHQEIFLVPRNVGYEGVERVVKRWLSFVRLVATDGLGSSVNIATRRGV